KVQTGETRLTNYDHMIIAALDKPVTIVEQGRKRRIQAGEAIIGRKTMLAPGGSRLNANDLIAQARAAEQQLRAAQEAQFCDWRDWHRKVGDPPLHWPPGQDRLTLPHPRDVYSVSRTVQFVGPLQREEVHL